MLKKNKIASIIFISITMITLISAIKIGNNTYIGNLLWWDKFKFNGYGYDYVVNAFVFCAALMLVDTASKGLEYIWLNWLKFSITVLMIISLASCLFFN